MNKFCKSTLISRRSILQQGLFWLSAGLSQPLWAAADPRPNVIVITTDDMGMEIGAYGDAQARTPYIDQMAREGVLFKRAYVTQSSCSPCRSSIITGLYPHQNGQIGLEQFGYTMRRGIPTLFSKLKASGYYTGWFGKVHVGPGDEMEASWDVHPFGAPFTSKVEKMAGWAEGFMKDAGERPFLLYYNLADPHAPFHDQIEGVPENPRQAGELKPWPWIGIQNASRVDQLVASYYNCVERADRGVGYLQEALQKVGKDSNTLIIFISDNGSGFPRAKTHNYNAGTQTPFILRWPGKVRAGSARNELVSVVDILPTILDACGMERPSGLPGASLLPLCRGENVPWRDAVFTEHTAHCPHQYFPRRAVFDGRYLLIWNLEGGSRKNPFPEGDVRSKVIIDLIGQKMDGSALDQALDRAIAPPMFELIDLHNDPAELVNLADNPEYAPMVEALKKRIQGWQKETADPLRIPENLKLMSTWHDELTATEEPKDAKGRPPYVQIEYVKPRYESLMKQIDANNPPVKK
jgi:N-sulfoglucosamine sulfohydrolase